MGIRLEVCLIETQSPNEQSLFFEFDQARVVLGRSASADVCLPHQAISLTHATIRENNTGYIILDEGSTNGVWFDGARLPLGRGKSLRSGDIFLLGPFKVIATIGIAIGQSTSSEQTEAHARNLLRQHDKQKNPLITIVNGPHTGQKIELSSEPATLTIGRAEHVDIRLDDVDCSREHAQLVVGETNVSVIDLDSKNGIFVNGQKVTDKKIKDRDEILIGSTILVFEDPAELIIKALHEAEDEQAPPPELKPTETQPSPLISETHSTQLPMEVLADVSESTLNALENQTNPDANLKSNNIQLSEPGKTQEKTLRVARKSSGFTDGLIYMLAGAVLALSIVGIYLLMRSD